MNDEERDTSRKMHRADLMGSHTHATRNGVSVHVYRRDGIYLARGYYDRRQFGETLGNGESSAIARLRELLVEIDNGTYVRPSEARQRPLRRAASTRGSLREILDAFLADVRKRRGRPTAQTYCARLLPVLDFIDQPPHRKRWPYGADLDREFVISLRAFLFQYRTTANGKAGSPARTMSVRSVQNSLECLRTALGWARRPDVRHLPSEWTNPLTADIIGSSPAKDPLRADPLPIETRIKIVERMDAWQLCHLALSFVLPLRPNEAVGLLVSEVDLALGRLTIGTRLAGADFTKARTSYTLAIPDEVRQLLRICIGVRAEGPLLRCRKAFADVGAEQRLDLLELFQSRLASAKPGSIQSEQDRKHLFRRLLREIGGVSENMLAKEFKRVSKIAGVPIVRFYELRHSVTKGLKQSGIPHLDLLYLTAHSTNSILNEYTSVDPFGSLATYFGTIKPLLAAIDRRAKELGLDAVESAQHSCYDKGIATISEQDRLDGARVVHDWCTPPNAADDHRA